MRCEKLPLSSVQERVMSSGKAALLAGVALCMAAISSSAYSHGFRHHPRASVGIHFGVPMFPRHYYYPRYYYPPAVVVAPAPMYVPPPVFIERDAPLEGSHAAPAADSGAYWYYCRDSQAYFPYVQQCPSAWDRVLPHAPPAS
jgi:hypothetical protein